MGKVMVVDDTVDACDLLGRLVQYLGYDALCITSGRDALEAIETHEIDLIILDVMMPDINGIELLRRIRSVPSTATVPIAMFSALSDPDLRERALATGADTYWVKGESDFDAIERLLMQWLPERSRRSDEVTERAAG